MDLRTIGAIDETAEQRKARRIETQRLIAEQKRRARGARHAPKSANDAKTGLGHGGMKGWTARHGTAGASGPVLACFHP